jgi:predicted transcriptional regulator
MEKLTKAEEEVMQLFWSNGPSTVSQLIEKMDEPRPPHSTISTFVRILEKKGFVDHKAYGRTYEYFPLIEKSDYSRFSIKKLVGNYFDGSLNSLVSFLVKEEDLSLNDLSNIINDLKDEEQ